MFYYPNRPSLIPPDKAHIDDLEQSGLWVAEQKWNGDNTEVFTGPILEFWNRRKEEYRYTPTPEVYQELRAFPINSLINLETVHYHTKTVKNLLIVHCILILKNQVLYGKTWQDSRNILETFSYGKNVVLSKIWITGFWDLYQEADGEIIEGIVLKKKTGLLKFSTTPIDDVGYMVKVRKPSKKYSF